MIESASSGWTESKLGRLGAVITGKTPSYKNPDDFGFDIPFVTPTDYRNYRKTACTSERYLSSAGASKLKNKILPPKSVMVTCIGSDMGKVAMNSTPVITNQQINSIVPDVTKVDPDFLYFRLVQSYDVLRSYGSDGTAVPILNKTDFENIEIFLPPLPEQRAIAGVLSSLDDKIDLLQRQNKTLEGMAAALWRKMFVEDAESGWNKGKLGDLVGVLSGFAFKSIDFIDDGKYRLVTIKNVQDGYLDLSRTDGINRIPLGMPNHCLLRIGDSLLSLTGNVGRCCLVSEKALLLNQRVAKLQARNSRDFAFAYVMFRQCTTRVVLEELARGTAQANLSPVDTANLEIPIPPEDVLEQYSRVATPLVKGVLNNVRQALTLSSLRDTLLPKLMSGEVRVKV